MGVMVYSLIWGMQDFDRGGVVFSKNSMPREPPCFVEPFLYSEGFTCSLHCSSFFWFHQLCIQKELQWRL